MKISYNWLKQYLPAEIFSYEDLSVDKISTILTFCGLEVSAVEKFQSIKGGLEGLVIGEVKSVTKHPNAEKLSLTTVDTGSGSLLKIVCGAPNVAEGQKVVVAPVGTTLYSFTGDELKIKKSKIRGEESEGMICAEDEIGLGSGHKGIMVLNPEAKTGTAAKDYFKIEDDWTIEIELTPNRSDAASHTGVARDLLAVLAARNPSLSLDWAHVIYPDVELFKADNQNRPIKVNVENTIACPRYSGLTITGVEVKESPQWLQNRLKSIGQKPINNIVDVTNFILHELGQPLHPFDADEISGDEVIVKTLPEGSSFITLDDKERKLHSEDLMICNNREGMCIAGVFGGIKSGVTAKTKTVFIESAYFNPTYIRKTAKRHDLHTDASFRFERGADINITVYALKRAALLIKEVAGGQISSDIVDIYPEKVNSFPVELEYEYCDRLIGKKIDRNTISRILTALQLRIEEESESKLILSVPTFKVDVQRPVDVIEEILRIYGYNNVEIPQQVRISVNNSPKPDKNKVQNIVANFLSSNGFREIMTNSLSNSAYYEKNGDCRREHSVTVLNPLSAELNVMRQTLLFSGLEAISYNQNRKKEDLKLYEFGNIYSYKQGESAALENYIEGNHLSLFLTGKTSEESWNSQEKKFDFFDIKQQVENILSRLGFDKGLTPSSVERNYLSEGLTYSLNNKTVAEFGRIVPSYLKDFSIKQDVYYADFYWDNVLDLLKRNKIIYNELPRFPSVRRDLAMILDRTVKYSEIEELAFQTEKYLLKEVNLFDVFEDPKGIKIPADKKSYAVSFVFQDEQKTLTDVQVEKMMEKLMNNFESKLGAQIRK